MRNKMYNIDFSKTMHIYFIGIGGISMSGFAELLHTKGFTISGSDTHKSSLTCHLQNQGISVVYEQKASNLSKNIDLVVYTAAIHADNPEYQEALRLQIPMINRAQMLGAIMRNFPYAIAISGTHGKTTTTSMLSHICLAADLDPTISVGGILELIHGNIRIGNSPYFITEACEYTNSFLELSPYIGIILNIEEDHLDFFKDIHQISDSFLKFAQKIQKDGFLLIDGITNDKFHITKKVQCRTFTYGLHQKKYDYSAVPVTNSTSSHTQFDLFHHEEWIAQISLQVQGVHNILNAVAAIATALELGISLSVIQKGLLSFHGADRRFQYKGTTHGITIIDDYAHHPTEIKMTLKTAKQGPYHEIWCVFQPHTYTRTKAFLKQFAEALSLADHIILTDIYAAREENPGDISSEDLQKELLQLHKDCFLISSFEEIEQFLFSHCTNNDLLITMGAGDIVLLGENMLAH